MSGGVYILRSPSGKAYVGQTTDFQKRFEAHKKASKKLKGNRYLYKAIQKYGWCQFEIFIVELPKNLWDSVETGCIEILETQNRELGYNLTSGGEKAKRHSPESIKLMSKNRLGKGRYSEERKKAQSLRLKGVALKSEHASKIKSALSTPEIRKLRSVNARAMQTPEHREKLSRITTGRPKSEETKRKMKEAQNRPERKALTSEQQSRPKSSLTRLRMKFAHQVRKFGPSFMDAWESQHILAPQEMV